MVVALTRVTQARQMRYALFKMPTGKHINDTRLIRTVANNPQIDVMYYFTWESANPIETPYASTLENPEQKPARLLSKI